MLPDRRIAGKKISKNFQSRPRSTETAVYKLLVFDVVAKLLKLLTSIKSENPQIPFDSLSFFC